MKQPLDQTLSAEEQARIARFRTFFAPATATARDGSYSLKQLSAVDGMQAALQEAKRILNTDESRVAASLLAKRIAYLLTVPACFAFTALNKALDPGADHIRIETAFTDGRWLPAIRFPNANITDLSCIRNREAYRANWLKNIFADRLYPYWGHLHALTGLSRLTLWENTVVYVDWIFSVMRREIEAPDVLARIEEDYRFIRFEANPALFGLAKTHPLQRFMPTPERKRITCCLSCRLESSQTCSTCPLLRNGREAVSGR